MAKRLRARSRHPRRRVLALVVVAGAAMTAAWVQLSSPALSPAVPVEAMIASRSTPSLRGGAGTDPSSDSPSGESRPSPDQVGFGTAASEPPPPTPGVQHDASAERPIEVAPPALRPAPTLPVATEQPVAPSGATASAAEALPVSEGRAAGSVTRAEAAAYVRRARDLIRTGNIAAARGVLEHAIESDDGEALFMLAETYDPAALQRWGARGIRANPDLARSLYGRASDQGWRAASQRLLALGR
ncbi:hypothetical protein [Methylobacterium oryzisoli]|uniref:hypothetical protein n=1 Tax=Methylobacterium oryzisoli TaxID=3385502 RepID=UPI0038922C65